MTNANRARRNGGKQSKAAQSANTPKTSPGKPLPPHYLSVAQMKSLSRTLKTLIKAIRVTRIDDEKMIVAEARCLDSIAQLQKGIRCALAGRKGGAR